MHTENPFAGKELVGGRICLDFANTLGQHEPEPLSEWLASYDDLVWWALRADILPENAEMQRVCEKLGFRLTRDLAEGTVRAGIDLG